MDFETMLYWLAATRDLLWSQYKDATDKQDISDSYDRWLAQDDAIDLLLKQKEEIEQLKAEKVGEKMDDKPRKYIDGKQDTMTPEECVDMLINVADKAGLLDMLRSKLLKEQKETWLQAIEDRKFEITDFKMHSRTDYEQGEWDGLNIAYEIVSDEWKVDE